MVNFPNIPAEGVQFRLRARDSGYVIYSRIQNDPLVWHYNGPPYDDQLFTLIYGTGSRLNLYAIKSVPNGRVLFSRNTASPTVGNVVGDGTYNDNWFQFIQDDNDANSFRIYSLASDSVLYSRTTADPQFGNYTGPKFDDQLWQFEIVSGQ
ncbi:hypothetical protein EV363DRAFT_467010 [Boletus edulis]|uniref:Uncharacterized protein n=1 Tax=Boletus edulis BED1 TaxID=1328754 RepID=A0AAD4BTW9_BOLED|nr:hypothetical protein EV363DRAFT_467010 [Boletus edulis]KAF8439900.1 hypothetical protein L210DRAFT_3540882 [Boletus edulis BED1]